MIIDIKRVKIFVTIPVENVSDVRDAVCKVGAGVIGEYTFCTSSTKSIGTFIPSENAKYTIEISDSLKDVTGRYLSDNKIENTMIITVHLNSINIVEHTQQITLLMFNITSKFLRNHIYKILLLFQG